MKKNKKIKMYSALEVANHCGVVNQTAINWIKSGYLNAVVTPGGQYRVYKEDLIAFMNNRGMKLPDELVDSETIAKWNYVAIIDDDKTLNNALAKFIRKEMPSLVVHQSFDGFEAGANLTKIKPGFIILDLDLPGVDGFEICNTLKTNGDYGSPYVIVITALETPDLKLKMKKIGADAFYNKPINFKIILDEIKEILDLN